MNEPYIVSIVTSQTYVYEDTKKIDLLLQELDPKPKKKLSYSVLSSMMVNGDIVIAKKKGKIIGIGSLSIIERFTHSEVEIYDLVVKKEDRRKGIGKSILSRLIQEASEVRNVTKIRIASPLNNEAMQKLCEKFGFKPSDTGYLLNLEIK